MEIRGEFNRGDVIWLDFGNPRGSEPSGPRPALIVQNNTGNVYSPNTIVAVITRTIREYPVNVIIEPADSGLPELSAVNCSLLLTISKERILSRVGPLAAHAMARVDTALKTSLALD